VIQTSRDNNSSLTDDGSSYHHRNHEVIMDCIRLLNVSRVRALDDSRKAASARALAQPRTSFCVRTADENHQFVFQAASKRDRDAAVLAWKIVISRFAALAVSEDATALLQEFFVLRRD
jgi:hypothetical protein